MSAYWPKKISDDDKKRGGRVAGTKDDATVAARERGETFTDESVADDFIKKSPPPCGEVLHISLFFDGTNNHLDWDAPSDGSGKSGCGLRLDPEFDDIPPPKSVEQATHSNVARLYRAGQSGEHQRCVYIPGVGTPLREVGEHLFSTGGKAFAHGLEERVCWAYLQILQCLYEALGTPFIPPNAPKNIPTFGRLFDDETVLSLCQGKLTRPLPATSVEMAIPFVSLNKALDQRDGCERQLAQCNEDYRQHSVMHPKIKNTMRHIKFVFINVFGFSRGAATARVFVNQLLNDWAPEHKLCQKIDYRVNFVGLFDTVASASDKFVLRPNIETSNYTNFVDRSLLLSEGHGRWCSPKNLSIPAEVRCCRHFFSIHEQRASFPLDVITDPNVYEALDPVEHPEIVGYPNKNPIRREVAYPGVHSDVGGGYPAKDQGKARAGHTHLLSKIPLHDMYIEALKAGVPLLVGSEIADNPDAPDDLALASEMIDAFNAWLGERSGKKTTVAEALATGFRESVAWRAYRNRPGAAYVDKQAFFKSASQDQLLPEELDRLLNEALKKDEEYQSLQKGTLTPTLQKVRHQHKTSKADGRMIEEAALRCKNRLLVKLAEENGVAHAYSRPGEDAWDLLTNDQSDLIEAAQDFQLLACNLLNPKRYLELPVPPKPGHWGCVYIDGGRSDNGEIITGFWAMQRDARYTTTEKAPLPRPPQSGRRLETYATAHALGTIRSVLFRSDAGDILFLPNKKKVVAEIQQILRRAPDAPPKPIYTLFDHFIHDSRAWFRVPRHHELSPGGYGFLRVFFTGKTRHDDYLTPEPVKQAPIPLTPVDTIPISVGGFPPEGVTVDGFWNAWVAGFPH